MLIIQIREDFKLDRLQNANKSFGSARSWVLSC